MSDTEVVPAEYAAHMIRKARSEANLAAARSALTNLLVVVFLLCAPAIVYGAYSAVL